jgi:regulatory protein
MSDWPDSSDASARRPPARRGGRRPGGRSGAPAGQALEDAPGSPEDEMGDPEAVARNLCLRALTGAPKTRQQLADLLAKRGVPEPAAIAVLDRFGEVGLIDDAAFARAWVSSRQAGRGLARRALQAELRAKGIDSEVAAEAVEAVDDEDERATARVLVERRLRGMSRLDRATAQRRLIGMLARKGYGGGLAAGVVRDALDGLGASGADDDPFDELDEMDDAGPLP